MAKDNVERVHQGEKEPRRRKQAGGKLQGSFVAFPFHVLDSFAFIHLSPGAVKLLLVMAQKWNYKKPRAPFAFAMSEADRYGMSPSAASGYIGELLEMRFIKCVRKGAFTSKKVPAMYELLWWHDEWREKLDKYDPDKHGPAPRRHKTSRGGKRRQEGLVDLPE